ncbi:MAG: tetratricopeptide repeat protein [Myxococcota bacterium]
MSSLPARVETGWKPVHVRGRPPALYRIPITLSLLGLFMIAIQAGQPLVGFASMMAVLATATALSLRTMSRRYAPAAILRDQGDAKMANGRHLEARAFYERALAIVQRELPPSSPEVLLCTYNLAVVSSIIGDHERAANCLDVLLQGLGGRVPGPWSGRIAWLLRRVSRHHSLHGRHPLAIEACETAIGLVGDAPGADDCTVRSLVNDLGWAHHRAGDLSAAREHFAEALSIHEQYRDIAIALATPQRGRHDVERSPYRAPSPTAASTSGGLDRAVAHSLVGLGWTALEQGRLAESDAAFGRALLMSNGSSRAEDVSLRSESLRGRAAVAFERGAYLDAERGYRRAAEALRPDAQRQAIALLLDRAWLACARGEDPRAEGLLVEAERRLQSKASLASLRGALHVTWAELKRRQCDFKAAHRHAQRAVLLTTEALAEHPRRASVLAVAARIHTARSEHAAAERCARAALQILRTRGLGEFHPRFSEVYLALAELQVARGHWGAAEREFELALSEREARVGPEHPALDEVLEGLAGVYEATQRTREAAGVYARLDAIRGVTRDETSVSA